MGVALLGGETVLLKITASRVHLDPEAVVADPGTFYVTNFRYDIYSHLFTLMLSLIITNQQTNNNNQNNK